MIPMEAVQNKMADTGDEPVYKCKTENIGHSDCSVYTFLQKNIILLL